MQTKFLVKKINWFAGDICRKKNIRRRNNFSQLLYFMYEKYNANILYTSSISSIYLFKMQMQYIIYKNWLYSLNFLYTIICKHKKSIILILLIIYIIDKYQKNETVTYVSPFTVNTSCIHQINFVSFIFNLFYCLNAKVFLLYFFIFYDII